MYVYFVMRWGGTGGKGQTIAYMLQTYAKQLMNEMHKDFKTESCFINVVATRKVELQQKKLLKI